MSETDSTTCLTEAQQYELRAFKALREFIQTVIDENKMESEMPYKLDTISNAAMKALIVEKLLPYNEPDGGMRAVKDGLAFLRTYRPNMELNLPEATIGKLARWCTLFIELYK